MLVNIMDLAIFKGKSIDYSNVDPNECPYLIIKLEHDIELSQNTLYLKITRYCTVNITNNLLYVQGNSRFYPCLGNKLLYIEGYRSGCCPEYLIYSDCSYNDLQKTVMYVIISDIPYNANIETLPCYMVYLYQRYLFIQNDIEHEFTLRYLQFIDITYNVININRRDWYTLNTYILLRIDKDNIIENAINALKNAVDLVNDFNHEKASIMENRLLKHFDHKCMYINVSYKIE